MDEPLDFSKSSLSTHKNVHNSPNVSSICSDESYLKFRDEILKKKKLDSDRSRRVSGFSSSSFCSQESLSNSPETSTEFTHSQSDTGNDELISPGSLSIDSSTPLGVARKKGKPLPDSAKDEAYWERRRKNNEAAKRSRDARRVKESEIAIRAAFLEQENSKLKSELSGLKKDNERLKYVMLQHFNGQVTIW